MILLVLGSATTVLWVSLHLIFYYLIKQHVVLSMVIFQAETTVLFCCCKRHGKDINSCLIDCSFQFLLSDQWQYLVSGLGRDMHETISLG